MTSEPCKPPGLQGTGFSTRHHEAAVVEIKNRCRACFCSPQLMEHQHITNNKLGPSPNCSPGWLPAGILASSALKRCDVCPTPSVTGPPRTQVFLRRRNHRGISHLEACCLPRRRHLRPGRRRCQSRSHDVSHSLLPATVQRALETGCSSPGWFAQSGASCPARVLLLRTIVLRTVENNSAAARSWSLK